VSYRIGYLMCCRSKNVAHSLHWNTAMWHFILLWDSRWN